MGRKRRRQLPERLPRMEAFFCFSSGKFHDRIAFWQARPTKYNQTDLREDLLRVQQPNASDGGKQSHRNNQDDHKRERPALY